MTAWLVAALLSGSPLVDAVKQQDVTAVRALLTTGVDVNAPEGDGTTALHWAVHAEQRELIQLLIAAGAKVEVANDLGITPLYLAAAAGNAAIAGWLLDHGARATTAAPSGVTALMEAARSGNLETVRLLLAHGADVNARERARHQTALMWAAARQQPEIVGLLLAQGADLQARTATRPLTVMLDRGPRRAVKTAVQDARILERGGSTALMFAAQSGSVASARQLLAGGANVNDHAADGTSALVMATLSGHPSLAALLLEAGADPNAAGSGHTALHAAALRGDLATVNALLGRGANPDLPITRGSPVRRFGSQWALPATLLGATPLIVAAAYAETEIVRALLAAGARADAALADGTAALLIAAGTPLDKEARPSDLARWNIVDSDTPVVPRAEADVLAVVTLLLDAGAQVNQVSLTTGDTALHGAAGEDLPAVIERLVERGASLTARNKDGHTPLELTLPRPPQGRSPGAPGLPRSEATLRKLGAS